MQSFEEFKAQTEQYNNTLVLDHFKVVMFKEVSKDEEDWYYDLIDEHGKKYSSSAVVSIVFLKGVIPERKYAQLVWQWNNFFETKYKDLLVN